MNTFTWFVLSPFSGPTSKMSSSTSNPTLPTNVVQRRRVSSFKRGNPKRASYPSGQTQGGDNSSKKCPSSVSDSSSSIEDRMSSSLSGASEEGM